MSNNEIDYEGWARAMCVLLDRVEAVTEDEIVLKICSDRFALAEQYGLDVIHTGQPLSVLEH